MEKITVKEQYERFKGAEWFDKIFKRDIMILGQGGIGSHLSFQLSRIGANLFLFDDDSFEKINMAGQFVDYEHLGMNKCAAISDILYTFSPDCEIDTNGRYTEDSMVNNITLTGFDNMDARALAFNKWEAEFINNRDAIFIDGRLLAEQFQIITVQGGKPEQAKKYREEYLFPDGEAIVRDCSFAQTTFAASMIAAKMTSFLVNWIVNCNSDVSIRSVPFFHEQFLNLNMCINEI